MSKRKRSIESENSNSSEEDFYFKAPVSEFNNLFDSFFSPFVKGLEENKFISDYSKSWKKVKKENFKSFVYNQFLKFYSDIERTRKQEECDDTQIIPKRKKAKTSKKKNSPNLWIHLPKDIWNIIFGHLKTSKLSHFFSFRRVCHTFRDLTNIFWEQKIPKCQLQFYFLQCKLLGWNPSPSIKVIINCESSNKALKYLTQGNIHSLDLQKLEKVTKKDLSVLPSSLTKLKIRDLNPTTKFSIQKLPRNLQNLTIGCSHPQVDAFQSLPPLTKLTFSCTLATNSLQYLPTSLRRLTLTCMKLDKESFKSLSNLQELNLRNCHLPEETLSHLPSTLNLLRISNDTVTKEGIKLLLELHPKLTIMIEDLNYLDWAIRNSQDQDILNEIIEFILAGSSETVQYNALFQACRIGKFHVVKLLLDRFGLDPNQTNEQFDSPLYLACLGFSEYLNSTSYYKFSVQIQSDYQKLISFLLENGVDPNACKNGHSPLYVAAATTCEILDLLIAKGGNIHYTTCHSGSSLLHHASKTGKYEIVENLIKLGANVNQQQKNGATPLLMATQKGHPKIVELLLKNGADPYPPYQDGNTLLIIACQVDSIASVRILLEHNVDPNFTARVDKMTPIFFAQSSTCVKLLINAGADINHLDIHQKKPVDYAHEKPYNNRDQIYILLKSS